MGWGEVARELGSSTRGAREGTGLEWRREATGLELVRRRRAVSV